MDKNISKNNTTADELINMIDQMQSTNKKRKIISYKKPEKVNEPQNENLDEYFNEAVREADARILKKERIKKMSEKINNSIHNLQIEDEYIYKDAIMNEAEEERDIPSNINIIEEENDVSNDIIISEEKEEKDIPEKLVMNEETPKLEEKKLYMSNPTVIKERAKKLVFYGKKTKNMSPDLMFNQVKRKKSMPKVNYNSYGEVKIKFDSRRGIYKLFENGEVLFKSNPVDIKFFKKMKFDRYFRHNEGKLYGADTIKTALKMVDPTVYQMLKHYDQLKLTNKASEYIDGILENNYSNLEYDFTNMRNLTKLNLWEKLKIKLIANKQEKLNIATVIKEPKTRRGIKRLAAALGTTLGIAAIGIPSYQISNAKDSYTEDKSNVYAEETTPAVEEINKVEITPNDSEVKENETIENVTTFSKYTQTVSAKEENEDIEKIELNQESTPEIDLKNITIGEEVLLSADKLYGSCEEQSKICNVNKLIENGKDVRITAGRIAVKTPDGYVENTKVEGTSINDLKEKYGEENEFWCNLDIEVDGVKYSTVGWTSLDNLEVKEKSEANKETEEAVKLALKNSNIDADFER